MFTELVSLESKYHAIFVRKKFDVYKTYKPHVSETHKVEIDDDECNRQTVNGEIKAQVPIKQEDTMFGEFSGSVQYRDKISKLFDGYIICTLCDVEREGWEEFQGHMVGCHHSRQGVNEDINENEAEPDIIENEAEPVVYEDIIENKAEPVVNEDNEKLFTCTQCKYRSKHKWDLNTHAEKTHSNDKPFTCTQCRYRSKRKWDLKTHVEKTHSNEKPFTCTRCGYKCKQMGDLKRHVKMKHSNGKPFACSQCAFKCTRNAELKRHVQKMLSSDI